MNTVFDVVQAMGIVVFLIGFASIPVALAAVFAQQGQAGDRLAFASGFDIDDFS